MKVRFIRERSFQAAGPQGPMTRVFAVGDVVELPETHAQMYVIQGDATLASEKAVKPAPVEDEVEAKPAAKRKK